LVERFRPLCIIFPPIAPFNFFAPLPLKVAYKGAIPPTLRITTLNKPCCIVDSTLLVVYDVIVTKYCKWKEDDNKKRFVWSR